MSHLRASEHDAAGIVKDALGGDRVEERDVSGAPEGTHDFDIMVGPRRVAVEVTRATNERLMQFYGALDKQYAGTGSTKLSAVHTTSRWSVWLRPTASG